MSDSTRLTLSEAPRVVTQMAIREPVSKVFEAFVDPAVTSKFWFTESTGKITKGADLTWTWGMYGVSGKVKVKDVKKDEKIVIEWNEEISPSQVEWTFQEKDGMTMVTMTESGFEGKGDDVVPRAIDTMGGHTQVLAGAKAYLEHGIELNLVADQMPPAFAPN